MMNYFLDTIFLIHITLLQCLIATFYKNEQFCRYMCLP